MSKDHFPEWPPNLIRILSASAKTKPKYFRWRVYGDATEMCINTYGSNELGQWVKDNIKNGYWLDASNNEPRTNMWQSFSIYFCDKEEAMLFRLIWG